MNPSKLHRYLGDIDLVLTFVLFSLLSTINKFSFYPAMHNLAKDNLQQSNHTCDNTNVYITVSDTGIGIPESQQEYIFDEYYQLDNKVRDHAKGIGFGFGLALVRRMCKLLQHEIRVESEVNKGTRFHLTLPLGNKNKVLVKQEQSISGSIENLNISMMSNPY